VIRWDGEKKVVGWVELQSEEMNVLRGCGKFIFASNVTQYKGSTGLEVVYVPAAEFCEMRLNAGGFRLWKLN
jgi:hypothetical protein